MLAGLTAALVQLKQPISFVPLLLKVAHKDIRCAVAKTDAAC
jgi:hypothetical protein